MHGFRGLAAGLGELAGDAAHADHGPAAPVGEGHGHLEQHPELALDGFGGAVLELFGTVAPLEQEPAASGGLGQEPPEAHHLLGDHQGWHAAEPGEDALQFRGVVVHRLLLGRKALPAVGIPGCHPPILDWFRRQRTRGKVVAGAAGLGQPRASMRSSGFRAWTLRFSSMVISGFRSRRQR